MITALNFYYAHAGEAEAVLRQRLYASDVRERIGIPRGTVIARTSGAADLPDVIWFQDFADVEAHERDMEARAASAEFERVRAGMRKLIRRFERPLFENCDAASKGEAEARPVIALDWIFCAPERTDEALAALQTLHAAAPRSARSPAVACGCRGPAPICRRFSGCAVTSMPRTPSTSARARSTPCRARFPASRIASSAAPGECTDWR